MHLHLCVCVCVCVILGLADRFLTLSKIVIGEAGKCAAQLAGSSKYVQESVKTMCYIVTVGWCI